MSYLEHQSVRAGIVFIALMVPGAGGAFGPEGVDERASVPSVSYLNVPDNGTERMTVIL
jgi:hypothetical protein